MACADSHDEVLAELEERLTHVFQRRLECKRLAGTEAVDVGGEQRVDVGLHRQHVRRERVPLSTGSPNCINYPSNCTCTCTRTRWLVLYITCTSLTY